MIRFRECQIENPETGLKLLFDSGRADGGGQPLARLSVEAEFCLSTIPPGSCHPPGNYRKLYYILSIIMYYYIIIHNIYIMILCYLYYIIKLYFNIILYC